jgi:hypothetical protein
MVKKTCTVTSEVKNQETDCCHRKTFHQRFSAESALGEWVPCGKIAAHWQIAGLPLYSPPLNLLVYITRCILKSKGNATTHRKMGFLQRTVWQLQAARVGQCPAKLPPALREGHWQQLLSLQCCGTENKTPGTVPF